MKALINMRHLLAASRKMSNAAVLLLAGTSITTAEPSSVQYTIAPLSQSEIYAAMIGHNLIGEYSNGQRWSEQLKTNMTTIYTEDKKAMVGHMRFSGSVLCFTYPQADDRQAHCFEIWKRGANCFDFYGADNLTATHDKRFGRGWMARAWRADQASTCQSDLIG